MAANYSYAGGVGLAAAAAACLSGEAGGGTSRWPLLAATARVAAALLAVAEFFSNSVCLQLRHTYSHHSCTCHYEGGYIKYMTWCQPYVIHVKRLLRVHT